MLHPCRACSNPSRVCPTEAEGVRLLADDAFGAAFAMLVVLMAMGRPFHGIVEGWDLLDLGEVA
jgi:hypothetical protein